jgi:uncharacterized protein YndB with AHSA1/START domain
MRIVGRLILVLLAVIVLLAAISFLLPREVRVTRSVTIDAPPEAVFPHVNSLQRFVEWSPWQGYDPAMAQTFSGPEAGVGNRMEWTSEDERVGSGSQEITVSVPNERVETALDFGGMGGTATLALAPVGAGTEVTWGLDSDMGMNPVGRFMGLMMDRWVGGDYERGLLQLKAQVEAE